MNNYQDFLSWCKNNNFSLLQFKKTISNQRLYCKFIEKNYKSKSMLQNVKDAEKLYVTIDKMKPSNDFLLRNLRMSVCELG